MTMRCSIIASVPPGPALGPFIIDQTGNSGIGDRYSVATPSGTGGLFHLAISCDAGCDAPDTDGFTLIDYFYFGTDNSWIYTYYRVADGSEGSTIEGYMHGDGAGGWSVLCARIGDADLSGPDVYGHNADFTGGASPLALNFTGVTTTKANCLLFVQAAVDNDVSGSVGAFTPPAGYINAAEGGSVTYSNLAWSSKSIALAGATGAANGSVLLTAPAVGYAVMGVAYKPAPEVPAGAIAPGDVTIMANSSDPSSAAMAVAYAAAWGIDSGNIITQDMGSSQEATTEIVDAARSAIASAGRQFTVLAMAFPSRNASGQSITSCITYGVRDVSDLTVSDLYEYSGLKPYDDTGYRPSILLISADYIQAANTLDSGTGYVVLAKDSPPDNIRGNSRAGEDLTGLTVFDSRADPAVGGGDNACNQLSQDCWVAGRTPVDPVKMYFGSMYVMGDDDGIDWLPGNYADNVTSYAGYLPDGYDGQTPMTWHLDRGACATTGTVIEPAQDKPGNSPSSVVEQFVDIGIFVPLFTGRTPVGIACWASIKCPDRALIAGDLMFRSNLS